MDLGEYQSNLDAFNSAKDQLSNLVDEGRELLSSKQSTLEKFGTVLQTGGDLSGTILSGLGTLAELTKGTQLEKGINSLKEQLGTLRENVTDGIQSGIESGISKATQAAKTLAGDNPSINSLIDSAGQTAQTTLKTAVQQATGGDFQSALNTLGDAGSQAVTTGSQAVQSGLVSGESVVNDLAQAGTRAASEAVQSGFSSVNQALAMSRNAGATVADSLIGNIQNLPTRGGVNSLVPSSARLSELSNPVESLNLPEFPGLSQAFNLVPKSTLAELEGAAYKLAPKFGSAESTVSELTNATGGLTQDMSAISQATSRALTQAPSKLYGIVNPGMRGDSTIARALRMQQTDKPTTVQTSESIQAKETDVFPTMQQYNEVQGFSDPFETVLSKYLPAGNLDNLGDFEMSYIASGIPSDVLRQADGGVNSSTMDTNIGQTRINSAEPSAQPERPGSEIEAATQPEPAGEAGAAIQAGGLQAEGAEGGAIGAGITGETAIEAGSAFGPEGLLAGALFAGVSSLIGSLIKDFEPKKPAIPSFANTGVSFAGQQLMGQGTAF